MSDTKELESLRNDLLQLVQAGSALDIDNFIHKNKLQTLPHEYEKVKHCDLFGEYGAWIYDQVPIASKIFYLQNIITLPVIKAAIDRNNNAIFQRIIVPKINYLNNTQWECYLYNTALTGEQLECLVLTLSKNGKLTKQFMSMFMSRVRSTLLMNLKHGFFRKFFNYDDMMNALVLRKDLKSLWKTVSFSTLFPDPQIYKQMLETAISELSENSWYLVLILQLLDNIGGTLTTKEYQHMIFEKVLCPFLTCLQSHSYTESYYYLTRFAISQTFDLYDFDFLEQENNACGYYFGEACHKIAHVALKTNEIKWLHNTCMLMKFYNVKWTINSSYRIDSIVKLVQLAYINNYLIRHINELSKMVHPKLKDIRKTELDYFVDIMQNHPSLYLRDILKLIHNYVGFIGDSESRF
jgi:hypothetical protein